MTLPKKSSRTITVDGTPFRWSARQDTKEVPGADSSDDRVPFRTHFFAHEDVPSHGALLTIEMDINVADIVTPPVAETLIRLGRKLGWDPGKSGKFSVSRDEMQNHLSAFNGV